MKNILQRLLLFLALVNAVILFACPAIKANMGNQQGSYVVELISDDNAQSFIDHCPDVLVVDFWSEGCAPCKVMKPMFEVLAKDLDGKRLYTFASINIKQCPYTAKKYRVMSVPMFGIFVKGKMIDKIVGQQKSKKTFRERIEKALLLAPTFKSIS